MLEAAEKIKEKLIMIRRELHRVPETGFDLEKTVTIVENELESIGIEYMRCGRAGVVATIGKKGGKCVLLRADMDALPINEESSLGADKEKGCEKNMHACGHDMHTAMLLGAARLLKERERELCGCVKLMLQGAEEILEGAKDMIESGLLDGDLPSAALMIHTLAASEIGCKSAIVSSGGICAPAVDYFKIKVKGKGCHGAMPEDGIDSVYAAASVVIALSEIISREISAIDKAVITVGSIESGEAANVIPDSVIINGTLRCFDENIRERLKERIKEIALYTAKAFRADADCEFVRGAPSFLSNKELSERVEKICVEMLGIENVYTTDELTRENGGKKGSGSEDFAYVSRRVPSVMIFLPSGERSNGYVYPAHHPKTEFDESALPVGAAIYAYTAKRLLEWK